VVFRDLEKAKLIVYHAYDIDPTNLPKRILKHQLNLFYNHESPYQCGNSYKELPKDFFNLSLTYRRDSDFNEVTDEFVPIDDQTNADDVWSWNDVNFNIKYYYESI
jgi:hypothetical protein